ncbi:MAG: ABC transporter ATP-binding protein [Actinomycetota bacterium]
MVFELADVSYEYQDKTPALVRISLRIGAGEKIAIMGANGSGKSTLLQIIDGLFYPASGLVTAFGRPLTEDRLKDPGETAEFRSRVGLVFQNPDVQLFSSTVRDEIAFGPAQLGLSPEQVKEYVDQIVEALDLGKLIKRHPYNLSGGEKKKVAVASVLSCRPEILLLDEPTAGLDPKTQAWIVDTIVDLNKEGKTIITATHDLAIVPEIADRVYVLGDNHSIVAEGAPSTVLQDGQLMLKANLAHFHVHRHSGQEHAHGHLHIQPDHHE